LFSQTAFFTKLPNEIILAIFHLVIASDHEFVIKLAQLCQNLRHVVNSEPLLWSSLSLHYYSPRMKPVLWKSRNRGILKALYLQNLHNSVGMHRVIKVLHDAPMNHLRTLSVIGISWTALCYTLPNITPSVISNLHYLELQDSKRGFTLFRDAVNLKLRHIVAYGTLLDWARLGEHVTHLVHLSFEEHISEEWVPDMLWVFYRNRNLESISLTSDSMRYEGGSLPAHTFPARSLPSCIELNRLSSLTLRGHMLRADYFLPHLSLPNLRHLKLNDLFEELEGTIRNLTDIGAADGLISLTITCMQNYIPPIDSGVLANLFRHAKQLQYLKLLQLPQIKDAIDYIIKESLCPYLREIELSESSDVTDELLVALVQSRNLLSTSDQSSTTHKLKINHRVSVPYDTTSWFNEHLMSI
jgi:F-box/TPR repeat protein Pof3